MATFHGQTVDYWIPNTDTTLPDSLWSRVDVLGRMTYASDGLRIRAEGTFDSDSDNAYIQYLPSASVTSGVLGIGFYHPTWVGTTDQIVQVFSGISSAFAEAIEYEFAQVIYHSGVYAGYLDSWTEYGHYMDLGGSTIQGVYLWIVIQIVAGATVVSIYNRDTHALIATATGTNPYTNLAYLRFGLTNSKGTTLPTGLVAHFTDFVLDTTHSLTTLTGWDPAPSVPTNLAVTPAPDTIVATCDAMTYATSYDWYLGGSLIGSSTLPTYTFTGLYAATAYSITVRATNTTGSSAVCTAVATTTTRDTPGSITLESLTTSTAVISWDSVLGESTYRITRNGEIVYTGSALTTSIAVEEGTAYELILYAINNAGVVGTASPILSIIVATYPTTLVTTPLTSSVQNLMERIWRESGEPSDLEPYAVSGTESSFTLARIESARLLRQLNMAQVRIANWRFQNGRIMRFKNLRSRLFWSSPAPITSSLTFASGSLVSLESGLSQDFNTEFDGWTLKMTSGDCSGQARLIVGSSTSGSSMSIALASAFSTTPAIGDTVSLYKNFALLYDNSDTTPYLSYHIPLNPVSTLVTILRIRDITSGVDLERTEFNDIMTSSIAKDGSPTAFMLNGNQIWFNTALSSARNFEIIYDRQPIALTTASQIPEIPLAYHEAMIYWAVHNIMRENADFTGAYATKRELVDLMESIRGPNDLDYDTEQGGITMYGG